VKVLVAMIAALAVALFVVALTVISVLAVIWPVVVLVAVAWVSVKIVRARRHPNIEDDPLVQAWSQPPPIAEPVESGRPHLRLVREGSS